MPHLQGTFPPRDRTCVSLTSPALAGGFFSTSYLGSPYLMGAVCCIVKKYLRQKWCLHNTAKVPNATELYT